MEIRRCMKCMKELKPGENVCPECGQDYGSTKAEPFALRPGTILDGKYLVGEVLGKGGFGITYIGFDLLLKHRVAIKEYFPMNTGMVSRDNRSTVIWSSTVMQQTGVEKGFDSFLKEARKMAKLGGIPGVVGVKSVFIQNETAYIVMEFVEGETLLKKLQREGPMDFDTCVALLTPIMKALAEVHTHGIIHRDISPDNIMVQKDGRLILLDLGAAKDLEISDADGAVQSSQLVAKQGFSPIEQYGRNGKIGPWTDVYAMAATIYHCCTGIVPPSAVDRITEDTLTCQPLLKKEQFGALAACMAIMPQDRPQSMAALMNTITPVLEWTKQPPPKSKPSKSKQLKHKSVKPISTRPPLPKRWIPALVAITLLIIAIGISVGSKEPSAVVAAGSAAGQVPSAVPTGAVPTTAETKIHMMAKTEDLSTSGYSERSEKPFWGQTDYKRCDVRTVTFQNTMNNIPDNAWDVSQAQDESVLAWMDCGNLHVAADGKIAPNSDASYLFSDFNSLKTIDFGDCFDTSNVTDMSWMFGDCSSLTGLDLSSFDTSNVTNMWCMFNGCSSLTGLDFSGFDTSKVTGSLDMFTNCSSLTSLDLSNLDTSKITDMSHMFHGCSSLTSLNLSGFDTSMVADMGGMFYDCSKLASLDLSVFDTSKVTDMSWMFTGCSSLTSLDLSSFDTSNVTNMWTMFTDCNSLTSLNLSSFDTSKVTNMSSMFSRCNSLSILDLSGFNTSEVTDMSSMFGYCNRLTSLDLSGFETTEVTDMSYMFSGCPKLTKLKSSDSRIIAAYNSRS